MLAILRLASIGLEELLVLRWVSQRHLVVKLAGKYPVKQFSDHFNGDAVASIFTKPCFIRLS
jgi:hypothetical protein